jgi:hypothetical protein
MRDEAKEAHSLASPSKRKPPALFADPATIGTRTAWLARLQAFTLRGHRLLKSSAKRVKDIRSGRGKTAP